MSGDTMMKRSVSFPTELDATIQTLVDEGVFENRSQFFRHAAAVQLLMMGVGADALKGILHESEDLYDAKTTVDKIGYMDHVDLAAQLLED